MIIALHGFLGLPSDWEPFRTSFEFSEFNSEGSLISVPAIFQARSLWSDLREVMARIRQETGTDLGSIYAPTATLAFDVWAEMFNQRIERMAKAVARPVKPILLGYSLGGRLAMHAIAKRPELYQGAILVSANPGTLTTTEEKETRYSNDEKWATLFLKDDWNQIVRTWNEQPVLKSSPGAEMGVSATLERSENEFDRILLSEALTAWSLARQTDLRPHLRRSNLLLVTGEFDRKFSDLTRAWVPTLTPSASAFNVKHEEIAGAGHRVPWDQPAKFQQAVQNWLGSLADF